MKGNLMTDSEQVTYWEGSASTYYDYYTEANRTISKVNSQIEYAEDLRSDIRALGEDNAEVDDELYTLGNALNDAFDDEEAGNAVMEMNSSYSENIMNAKNKCTELIEALETDLQNLMDDREWFHTNYEDCLSIADTYR